MIKFCAVPCTCCGSAGGSGAGGSGAGAGGGVGGGVGGGARKRQARHEVNAEHLESFRLKQAAEVGGDDESKDDKQAVAGSVAAAADAAGAPHDA